MADDPRINRRKFFRQGLSELLRPLAQAASPIQEAILQINSIDAEKARAEQRMAEASMEKMKVRGATDVWHRPPGALGEQEFQDTCSRCAQCVGVCPVQCIKIDPAAQRGAGLPYIDVDANPCVLCDGLLCMHNCPTGALKPIPLGEIDMGTAVWHEDVCLRSKGQDCTICVDRCPVGEMALVLGDGKVRVIEEGCSGCGVCQHHCPTSPKSITVTPRAGNKPVSRGRPR